MAAPSRREWADFERLIARIETTLAPNGAVVRCPDNEVIDLDTGAHRNVDATVRWEDCGQTRFMAFECRRRGRRRTVEWVESLIAKKASIGADKMVGVSSAGFARNAIKKAAARGVDLRTARSLDEGVLGAWIAFKAVQMVNTRWSALQVYFFLYDPQPDDELWMPVDAHGSVNGNTPCIHVEPGPSPVSIHRFLEMARSGEQWPEAPHLCPQEQWLNVNCERPVWIDTNKGRKQVQTVRALCRYAHVPSEGPLVAAVRYAEANAGILDAAHFDLSGSLPGFVLAFHRDAATGQTSVSFVREPQRGGL